MDSLTWEAWPMWLVFSALILMPFVIGVVTALNRLRDSKTKKEIKKSLRVISSEEAMHPELARCRQVRILEVLRKACSENRNTFEGKTFSQLLSVDWRTTKDYKGAVVLVDGNIIIAKILFSNDGPIVTLIDLCRKRGEYQPRELERALKVVCEYVTSFGGK